MTEVIIEPDHDFEGCLKRFRKKVEQDGVLQQPKEKAHYQTPSEKKKRKREQAGRK